MYFEEKCQLGFSHPTSFLDDQEESEDQHYSYA